MPGKPHGFEWPMRGWNIGQASRPGPVPIPVSLYGNIVSEDAQLFAKHPSLHRLKTTMSS